MNIIEKIRSLFRSPSAFKNIQKRIPLWMFSALVISGTLHWMPNLKGLLLSYIEFIAAVLGDEYLKEGYWYNIREATPQTHEAVVAETIVLSIFVIGALLHNPLVILILVGIALLSTFG